MLKNADGGVVKITPSEAGSYDPSSKIITFNSDYKNGAIIEYVTKITPDQMKNVEGSKTNKAILKKGEDKISEDSETVNLWKEPFTVNKKGIADYEKQSGSTYDNKIDWTITVKNEYGASLDGYLIEDVNIPDSGATLLPSGSLEKSGDKWKINAGGASEVKITYTTDAVSGINSNTAKLYYPTGEPTGKEGNDDVEYKDKNALISFDKTSFVKSNGTIEWTIAINNQNGLALDGYTITDKMLPDAIPSSFTINPANAGKLENATVTLNDAASSAQWITIKYSTKLTPQQLRDGEASNKAELKDPDDKPVKEDEDKPKLEKNPFSIEKTGTPDYISSGEYPASGNKIKWKIKITSNKGVSLDGYIIDDPEIPSDAVIKVSPKGSLTKTNGKWVLNGTGNSTSITLEYDAPAQVGKENVNPVELEYPDDEPTGKKTEGKVTYKSQSELVELANKSGYYNQDSHEINWTINVKVEGGYDIGANHYVIYDDMFKNLDIEDIQIAYQPAGNYAVLDKTAGTLTFNSKPNGNNFNITYTTKVDIPSNAKATTMNINNGYGPGPGTTQTATVPVPVRDELNKTLRSSKNETQEHSGELVRTLNWTANITHDGTFNNLTYTDELSVSRAGDEHIITDDQIAALKVYGSVNQGDTLLTKGVDYELVKNADGRGFVITFKDTLDAKGYNYVKIEYQTKATSKSVASGENYPVKSEFSNNASFNNNPSTDKFTLTRNDPEIHTNLNLNIKKEWENDDTAIRPQNAYFKVLYHTGDYNWQYLKGSGSNYLFKGDSGYSLASDYLAVLNGAAWSADINGLPQHIRKANSDGSAGKDVYYYYKIEEVNSNGSSIENNLLKVNGGSYKVSYANNSGVNTDNIYINAKNTLYRDQNITPQKTWGGNTGSGTGINSITVQLEYSTNGEYGPFYPVRKDNSGNYVFDQNSTDDIVIQDLSGIERKWIGNTWENLPQIIPVGNDSQPCQYRIREIKYNDTEISGDQFVADGGYYKISYSIDSGNFAVVNEYKANKSISYTASKKWNNDTSYLSNRPDTILVQLKQNGQPYGDPVELSLSSKWSYTWNNLPNQSTEAGNIVTYTYTAEEVGFKKSGINSGEAVDITQNYFATTGDGWYNIAHQHDKELLKTTITNTFEPVSTISITPQKKWVGDNEDSAVTGNPLLDANRPKNVTLKLQKKLGSSGVWTDVLGEDKQSVTIVLSSSDVSESDSTIWQSESIGNLPAEELVITDDGKSTKYSVSYRLVETAYTDANGQAQTLSGGTESFKTENGKYIISVQTTSSSGDLAVTNTFEEAVGIDKNIYNGDTLVKSVVIDKEKILTEDSPFIKIIDGKKYFVFNYAINFEATENTFVKPFVDKMPDGFTLIEDTSEDIKDPVGWGDGSSIKADPVYILNGDGTATDDHFTGGYYRRPTMLYAGFGLNHPTAQDKNYVLTQPDDSYYYDTVNNQVWFNKPNITASKENPTILIFCYAIKMEYDKFVDMIGENASYSIPNTAELVEPTTGTPTGMTSASSIKVINKNGEKLITKTYAGDTNVPGYVKYSINVNPEGKNLSTGDTIDIQDLLETVSYYDNDYAGEKTSYGKKLVDILMDEIKLYEVDANGNKIELPSNKYTLIFQNGEQVSNGAALMKLTIPDETHIVVEYTYKMIANESTPSVIHKCKSSTRVNGRIAVMQPGFVPPTGDKITLSNKAKLISDSASDESKEVKHEYTVFKSDGMITVEFLPQIVKVNTGNYTINDLEASFLLAKYENGKWYYAVSINDADENSDRTITWSTSGVDGQKIPANAKQIDVKTAYAVAFDETVLYKLVEVSVPYGYEGSNLGLDNSQFKELITSYLNSGSTYYNGKDYAVFLDNYINTYYFAYNSIIREYPDNVTPDKIMQIKSGDNVEIPNNELIDIGIQKDWINPKTSTADSKITVELWWSSTKASIGMPADAKLVKAEDLGIMSADFSAKKTISITYDEKGNVIPNEKVWTDLPNGKNSKPIYYYVKETGYTIGNKTYVLDKDGNFTNESGDVGAYKPTYIGNAANFDATVNVRNSYQLMLKKSWKNSANIEMKNIPVEKVTVSIYGIDQDGVKSNEPLFTDIELSADNNWQFDLTDDLDPDMDLSQYKSFVAEENESAELDDYVVSCVFNLNDGTGEIVVTNKNTIPTEASVKVQKVWSDGTLIHKNESIKVSLYQSKKKLDNLSDLELKLKNSASIMQKIDENDKQIYENVILNDKNDWSFAWTGLPLEDENQSKYYYYVLEDTTGIADADEYTASYEIIGQKQTSTEYKITNTRKAIIVQKKWVDENGYSIPNEELNQNSITLDVLKKVPNAPSDGIKLIAFGDSITDGYGATEPNCSKNGKDYPSKLMDLLTSAGYTIENNGSIWEFNKGESGQQIGGSGYEGFRGRINTAIPDDTDIVCFIGGTNDIHQSSSGVKGDPQGVYERFEACINEIRTRVPDAIIFVGSIPHFNFWKNGQETDGGKWWSWLTDYSADNGAIPNGLIDQYNDKIEEYAARTDGVYFVDVCSVVIPDYIRDDGCHPNEAGYTAIANAFYNEIQNTYNQTDRVGEITLTKENNWIGAFDISDEDALAEYYIDESNVPAGWQVTYENQNQNLGSTTPIIAKNTRRVPKTSLSVKKTWQNDTGGESNRDSISLALLQSIDLKNWSEYEAAMPVPTKSDNIWTYNYDNLPAEDNAGNRYYYKIEEAPMVGYTTSYGTPNYLKSVDDSSAGALEITNTASVSLKIRKEWTDIDTNNHLKDVVRFKLYRAVGERNNTDDVNLILELDSNNVGVTVGNTVSAAANKAVTISQSDGSESIFNAVLAGDGKTINIEGLSEGTGTITVTDGTDTKIINVTVSAYNLLLDGAENFVITAGENNHVLSVTKGGSSFADVTYSSSNPNVLTVGADGTINTVNAGTATITVSTDGNVILTQDITVNLPDDFNIIGEQYEVAMKEHIQLSVSPIYGSFTWNSSDESIAIVDQTGKITGVAVGNATITVTRNDGLSKTYDVSVIDGGVKFDTGSEEVEVIIDKTKKISKIEIEFDENNIPSESWYNIQSNLTYYDTWTNQYWPHDETLFSLTFANDSGSKKITTSSSSDKVKINIDGYKVTIEINNPSSYDYSKGDGKFTISSSGSGWQGKYRIVYMSDESAQVLSLRSVTREQILLGAGTNAELLDTIEIVGGSAGGWEKVVENLDVYAPDGRPYIYWVEEEEVPGYEASYQFSDGNSESSYWIDASKPNADGELAATVRNNSKDTPGYELPNTGGEGVHVYYYTGVAMILLSAFAGSNRIRRRLKQRCTK
ncbi:MAG: Cna B-type domain-containing protein [Ruminococcus sp.]|nr:Cna B-type domain-containing protein [Ruminococcus sp.]